MVLLSFFGEETPRGARRIARGVRKRRGTEPNVLVSILLPRVGGSPPVAVLST